MTRRLTARMAVVAVTAVLVASVAAAPSATAAPSGSTPATTTTPATSSTTTTEPLPAGGVAGIHSSAHAPTGSTGDSSSRPSGSGSSGLASPLATTPQLTIAQSDCMSSTSTAADLQAQFNQRGPVWGGGDGAQPIPIDGGRTLWLFGDTYIGGGPYGGPLNSTGLVHNSMVVQYNGRCFVSLLGKSGTTWSSAIPGPNAKEWYWPNDGVYDPHTGVLSIVALHVRETTGGQWGWTLLGTDVLRYRVEPSITQIGVQNLFSYSAGDLAQFGASLMVRGNSAYFFGCAQQLPHQCYAATTNLALDVSTLQFLTAAGTWSPLEAEAAPLDLEDFDGLELHVIPSGDGFLATSQVALLSTSTSAWWGPTPTGPFTPIGPMFDPGALPWNQFTYGGRLISTSAGTIGVYSLNTFDDQGAEVAGLYGPRFVALSAHVLDRDPFGNYESLTTGPDAVTLSGWSIDPDTGGPNDVDVWIDDSFAGTTVAGNDRDDVGASFPDYGPDHGFSVTLPVAAGSHSVCAYSINLVAGRSNRALGCRTATVGGTPVGNFESLAAGPDQVSLSGWALDPDTSAPIHVDVWIDGHFAGTTVAVDERDDVGASFPEFGSDHGFTVTLPVGAGTHSVCAYAINMGSGSANRKLSCRTATVGGNPKGNLESVTRVGATVTASGWALDPDTADPITVHVYVDSHWAAEATAGGSRADVGAAFPGYGSLHGFGVPVTVSAGSHTVCAYAINSGAGNTNTKLGCRSI